MSGCTLCPRQCGVSRPARTDKPVAGSVCGMGTDAVVARAALHFWEEPCLSGKNGSGTVFFSGCPLRCVFCQNRTISADRFGKALSPAELRAVFDNLIAQGAHNLNLVTPTHFVPAILKALGDGVPVPVVYNTGGYESLDTLHLLDGHVDVYLPDMKYRDGTMAKRYSKAPDYPEVAAEAIKEMFRQVGPVQFDEHGLLQKGMIIRHLLLPGGLQNTKAVIDWVADTFPKGAVLFSLMSQYTPVSLPDGYPELDRRLTTRECTRAADYLAERGIEAGYVQERSSAKEEYIPAFDLTGL